MSDTQTQSNEVAPQAPEASNIKGQSQNNGNSKAPEAKDNSAAGEGPKLSNAELKKLAKAEKAARRALAKQTGPTHQHPAGGKPDQSQQGQTQKARGGGKGNDKSQQKRGGSTATLPARGATQSHVTNTSPPEVKEEDKRVEVFRHLYFHRATTIAGAGKEVHPTVLALGQQMRSYSICGSNARLVATLQAFKRVIESYTTPPGNTLARHLTSHVLSPQIEYLVSCRPMSISMGNAIRWLKVEISKIGPEVSDMEAKKSLCSAIDIFIRDRVTMADAVISSCAADKIKDGDVILTYAKSSIVQQTLVQAHSEGKRFRVIIVDSRPLREGLNLARALSTIGLDIKYCLMNGLSHNVRDATKVMLGAHAMMSNGRLFSRVGTALVAMEASDLDIPVIVLCETVKFTERVALDSIVHNEIAPSDELLLPPAEAANCVLAGWQDMKHLQLCNPLYDVTPAEYIRMLVTELGVVPPTSVPVLHRLGNEGQ